MVQRWKRNIGYLITIAAVAGVGFFAAPTAAQLVPDNSLGVERSVVSPGVNGQGQVADIVSGGARRGGNLFHSFQEFNVGNLQRAYFNNPVGVENILSRVTGSNRSIIRGTLGVLGEANLFLLNPNGILFGPNATLDIRGSFVASTASSIRFADGVEFSAVNPSTTPLLTVSVPIGLQFNGGEGDIVVRAGQVPRSRNPFTEGEDAGQLLETAQTVDSPTSNAVVDSISGSLNSATDVDLYELFLTEGQPFTASTVGGTLLNTQLFLFDSNGLGVFANTYSTGFQSTVPLYQPFIPERSGTYYLAISNYNNDPRNSRGDIFDAAETPNGSGAAFPLDSWNEMPLITTVYPSNGAYTIALNPRREGLQVQPGRTLALVGNQVRLEGGRLEARGGRVELVGVDGDGAGVVGLARRGQEWQLSISDRLASADVILRGNSLVNVSAGGGGSIAIHGRDVNLTTSSLLAGMAPESGSIGSRAGNIEINAARAINLDSSSVTNDVAVGAVGDGGNINITTGAFSAIDGSGLYVYVYGSGTGGNVTIEAQNAVSFDFSFAQSIVAPLGQGRGGDVRIAADSVSLTRTAQLASLTQGNGDAGDVIVNARDTVRIDGKGSFDIEDSEVEISSAIFSSVGDASPVGMMANGRGGNIHLTADSVFVIDNGALIADTYGRGNAGNVTIHALDTVNFWEGRVASDTFGRGNAGDIEIHARDTVSFNGELSGASSGISPEGTGNGGDITITGGSVLLNNGALLRASSAGEGNAGTVTIDAGRIQLDNQSGIDADTVGDGGNVDLRSPLLILRNNSSITTNAEGTATGGNINIDAGSGFIVAPLNENNDIIANGVEGSGGQITLTAQGIYGFDFRTREDLQQLLNTTVPEQLDPRDLPTNDVTAFSQANPTIDTGSVTVQTPNLDPIRRLTELPADLSDPSDMIASACSTTGGSSFAITGRGGLPEDPYQPLVGQVVLEEEWETGEIGEEREVREEREEQEEVDSGVESIAEAQGWIVDRTGTVVLVTQPPQTQQSVAFGHPSCAASSSSP